MSNIIKLTKMSLYNLTSVFKQIGLILGVWAVVAFVNPMFNNILLGMGIFMIVYQLMAYEDMAGIDNLIASLPVKKSEYVLSRYLVGALTSIMVIILVVVIYYTSPSPEKMEFPVQILLMAGLTIAVISNSIMIPITIKWGINKGRLFTMALTVLIGMGPAFLLEYVGEKSASMENIIAFINSLDMTTVVISVNVAILLISIFFSIKLYKTKEVK